MPFTFCCASNRDRVHDPRRERLPNVCMRVLNRLTHVLFGNHIVFCPPPIVNLTLDSHPSPHLLGHSAR